jgi:hypothetical protein
VIEQQICTLILRRRAMGILLVVVVVLGLIAIAAPVWKGYEAELRRNPRNSSTNDSVDAILLADAGDPGSSGHGPSGHASTTHSLHHVDLGCTDSHHAAGCDVGGHGSFDGGGHH